MAEQQVNRSCIRTFITGTERMGLHIYSNIVIDYSPLRMPPTIFFCSDPSLLPSLPPLPPPSPPLQVKSSDTYSHSDSSGGQRALQACASTSRRHGRL